MEEVLRKIEHIVTEKTQRLTFIEESLHELAAQLAQPSCAVELVKLQQQYDKAEEENLSLQAENLKLKKQIREYRHNGSLSDSPATSTDDAELHTRLEQTQKELTARNDELANLKEELERQNADNDTYVENLNAQLAALRNQLEDTQGNSTLTEEHEEQLLQAQQKAEALSTQVCELQQQLDSARTAVQEAEQNISQLTSQLEQQSADAAASRNQTTQLQEQEKKLAEQLQSALADLKSKSDEAAELTTRLGTAETTVATLRDEKTALAGQIETGQQEISTFREMQKRFFPDCLLIPAIEPFIAEWQAQFTSSEPDYKVLSMFSYLFSWSSLLENVRKNPENLNSNVEKEAISAIAYFSRYFLEALYAKGISPDDAQNLSMELIERFNKVLSSVGTKHQLFVPFLGESYDNKTMMPDSSRGNTYGEVEALLSWGVHNPETEITFSKCQVQLD